MSEAEEFGIFDQADLFDWSDAAGNLYGLRLAVDRSVLVLGTQNEQVAKFWFAGDQPWHGFPLWPLARTGAGSRRKHPASREALRKMESARALTAAQRRRLQKGDHVG